MANERKREREMKEIINYIDNMEEEEDDEVANGGGSGGSVFLNKLLINNSNNNRADYVENSSSTSSYLSRKKFNETNSKSSSFISSSTSSSSSPQTTNSEKNFLLTSNHDEDDDASSQMNNRINLPQEIASFERNDNQVNNYNLLNRKVSTERKQLVEENLITNKNKNSELIGSRKERLRNFLNRNALEEDSLPVVKHKQYQYWQQPNRKSDSTANQKSDLKIKLTDLIDPNRNQTFIDNLYAQFQSDTNRINLLYLPDMQKAPSNSILLNSLSNTSSINYYNATSNNRTMQDTNRLLDDFFLDVKTSTKTNSTLDRGLMASEFFLICVVISLWLISVFVCLRRYSLFICFHKNDVPFYDASLLNVKLHKDPTILSNQPVVQADTNNNETDNLVPNNGDPTDQQQQSEGGGESLANFNRNRGNSCGIRSINNLPNIPNSTISCTNMNEFVTNKLYSKNANIYQTRLGKSYNYNDYKSASQGNFNSCKIIAPSTKNHSPMSTSNYFGNKLKMMHCKNVNLYDSDYYVDASCNRMPMRYSSALLASVNKTASVGKLKKAKKSSKASTASVNKQQQHSIIATLNPNTNSVVMEKSVVSFMDTVDANNKTLKSKRALMRKDNKQHFNLMSLDETALNLYRHQHQLNQLQRNRKQKQKAQNLTVATVLSNGNSSSGNSSTNGQINSNSAVDSHSASRARLFLATPHSNFTSVRSGGSDSENVSWLNIPSQSLDFSEGNEESSDPLQSPTAKLKPEQQTVSSNNIQDDAPNSNSNINLSRPQLPSNNNRRQINPLSYLKRHMFVNSRHAQTTVDYANQSRQFDDTFDNSSKDYGNSMSIVSETMPSSLACVNTNTNNLGRETSPLPAIATESHESIKDGEADLESSTNNNNNNKLLNPEW